MKFTLSWLKEHLDTKASLDDLLVTLTKIGLEVDGVQDAGQVLAPFRVAHILSTEPHPEADRLKVCQVDAGGPETIQIVCGGPNARAGIKVVLAQVGVTIPANGLVIKDSKIRGVASCGMMCSLDELGLGDGGGNIIELPESTPLTQSVAEALGMNDPVIEIGLTPNRGDCAGVRGIARDLAAAGMGTLKPLKERKLSPTFKSPIDVLLRLPKGAENACPQFGGCFVRGVKNGPSPDWLRRKLEAVGAKSISTLVDITNFLTFDQSRPIHVFDADKLRGNLTITMAEEGEPCKALNGATYSMTPEDVVIRDDSEVVSFGGIMGGLDSGVSFETKDVFVECALFDAKRIALSGRHHGIISDARYRFERGMDPASVVPGLTQAVAMIQELCGGEVSELVIAGHEPKWQRTVTMRFERLKAMTGLDLSPKEIEGYFKALDFGVKLGANSITVDVPSWRVDVSQEEDLIEEVVRLYGLDRLPPVSLPRTEMVPAAAFSPFTLRSSRIRRTLAARGMQEALTWSFMAANDVAHFGGMNPDLTLLNPISQDLSELRPSILSNLLRATARNLHQGTSRGALFEVGPVYTDLTPEGQIECVTGVRFGQNHEEHWQKGHRAVSVYDVKADVAAIMELCGFESGNYQITDGAPEWFHPGRSGVIKQGPKQILGYFGELHPLILEHMDIATPVMGFELFLSRIGMRRQKAKSFVVPAFQSVERDFAFLVDVLTPADSLVQVALKVDPKLIVHAWVFDVYAGKGIPEGFKSIALRVRIQPITHTLTDQEISDLSGKIIETITQKTGASLRA